MIRLLMSRIALPCAMLFVVAACGSATAGTTSPTLPSISDQSTEAEAAVGDEATTSTTAAIDPEEAMQQYAACMRENGVDMPDPGSDGSIMIGGPDTDETSLDAAMAECDPILEDAFGDFEMSPEMEAEQRDMDLAFARCMRENGLEEWADPDSDGGMAITLDPDTDPDTVNAAVNVCSKQEFGESSTMDLVAEPSS